MIRAGCLVLAVLALGGGGLIPAAEPGFTPLFDGSTLSGWRYGKDALGGQSATSDRRFQVANGVLTMAPEDRLKKRDQRDLLSAHDFNKDFILRLEFRAGEEATGSVTVRNVVVPVADFVRRGIQKMKNFKNDDWNELEVQVRMSASVPGRALADSDQVKISFQNGKAVVTVNGTAVDPNPAVIHTLLHARCNGEGIVNVSSRSIASTGTIGLRTGSGKIEFRNIRFRDLP